MASLVKRFALSLTGAVFVAAMLGSRAQAVVYAANTPAFVDLRGVMGGAIIEAQTFTASATGPVREVDLPFLKSITASSNLTLTIQSVDQTSGMPTGDILGSVTLTPDQVTSSSDLALVYTKFDFSSSPITVSAGTSYALALTCPTTDFKYEIGTSSDFYAGGIALASLDGGLTYAPFNNGFRDWAFQVTDVPEPGGSFAIAGAVLLLVRRRGGCVPLS